MSLNWIPTAPTCGRVSFHMRHPNALVKDGDVETVLTRFQQEVEASSISRRITIDTTQKTPLACVAEFDAKIRSLFTQTEKLREKTHKILETA